METFVQNAATASCCGKPVADGKCQCRNGGSTSHQPTRRPTFFGAQAGGSVSNGDKPQPLGIPVMNFDAEQPSDTKPAEATTQNKRSDGKPTPLGIPSMQF